MSAGYSFRPRVWALALAAAACAAGIAAGNWQSRRAEEKRAIAVSMQEALLSPAVEISPSPVQKKSLVYKRVAARGEFVPQHTVYLDNKLRGGKVGYEVVTPLRIAGSKMHVLVNRGWVERERREQVTTPRGVVRVSGIALEHLPRVLQMNEPPAGSIRQNLDIAAFAAETGLELQPIVIEAHFIPEDNLLREWPRPDLGIEKHQAYAVQWYALAGLAVVLVVALSFKKIDAS